MVDIRNQIAILFFVVSLSFGQSANNLDYYPLSVGDIKYYGSAPSIVIGKVSFANNEYFKITDYLSNSYERVDAEGNVYSKRGNYPEELYIKLNAKVGEKWETNISGKEVTVTLESNTDTIKTNDWTYYNCKRYSYYYKTVVDANYKIWLAKDIGIVKRYSIDWGTAAYFIKGKIGSQKFPINDFFNSIIFSIPSKNAVGFPIDGGIRLQPKFLLRNEFINSKYFSIESKKQGKLPFTFPSFYDTIKTYYYLDFILANNFEYDDEIKVTVSKDVEDLLGDKLASDYELTFYTEKKRTEPIIFEKDILNKLGSGFLGSFDVADYNNDGKADYVFSSDTLSGVFCSSGDVFVEENYTKSQLKFNTWTENVKFVDYNNDGCLDVSLAARLNNVTPFKYLIQLFTNRNNKLVPDSVLSLQAIWMGWHDFTKDGLVDLVASHYEQARRTITIYKNEYGFFSNYLSYKLPDNSEGAISLIDIDGDSEKEIVKTNSYSNVVLDVENNSLVRQNFNFPFFAELGPFWGVDCADIDKDGDKDLIVGSYLCFRSGNEFVLDNSTIVKHTTTFPKFYDFDKDGNVDLYLVGNRSDAAGREFAYIQIYKNTSGLLKLIYEQQLNTIVSCYAQISDLDKDGLLDIVIFNQGLQIYYNKSIKTYIEDNIKAIPSNFSLSQNYPNPFNPETTIEYTIPVETRHASSLQHVVLRVYDVLGREVATLVSEVKAPGNYIVTFNARHLERSREIPSGIYFYRIQAGKYSETKKMLLIK